MTEPERMDLLGNWWTVWGKCIIAAGSPCRILRPITDNDRKKWKKQREYHSR